jgi:hypothetical protein
MELHTCHPGKACCGSCANYEVLPDHFVHGTIDVFPLPTTKRGVERGKLSRALVPDHGELSMLLSSCCATFML